MDPRHAILFEPVTIGPRTAPNRFYHVPHASGFGIGQPRTQAAFRAVKARGGWGTVCTEFAPVSADSDESPEIAANAWTPAQLERARPLVEAVHEHGSLVGIELHHGGHWSQNGASRLPRTAVSASASPSLLSSMPRELTREDIQRIQRDYAAAARHARDVGFDIVYVYAAHGYLLNQFLSTATNLRTDEYGGSLSNRIRMHAETLSAVREAVGGDCAIAVRASAGPGTMIPGVTADEMLEAIARLDHLVDLWDVNVGRWPEDSGTSRYFPEGHQLPWTTRVREVTNTPIVGVGRFTSPDVMASLIRSGQFDLIGAARPAIADPYLPEKIRSGRVEQIRECTGSNVCILKEEAFKHIGCIQNPTAGEEFRRGWDPESYPPAPDPDIPVLVVGGGPAGMECAMVLGLRGFTAVHLVDDNSELGGKLRWTRHLPGLGDWGRIVDHRLVSLGRLPHVEVILNRRMTPQDILDYGAGIVVIATGSHWSGGAQQGFDLPPMTGADRTLTPEQIVSGRRPPDGPVVIYDVDGYYLGVGMAELLAAEGREVHVVTTHSVLSPTSDLTLEGGFLRRRLHGMGVLVHTERHIETIEEGRVGGHTLLGQEWSLPAGGVVLVTRQTSDDELYQSLRAAPEACATAGIVSLHLIGDAAAPRMPSEAVFDGHLLARTIELDSAARRTWRSEIEEAPA